MPRPGPHDLHLQPGAAGLPLHPLHHIGGPDSTWWVNRDRIPRSPHTHTHPMVRHPGPPLAVNPFANPLGSPTQSTPFATWLSHTLLPPPWPISSVYSLCPYAWFTHPTHFLRSIPFSPPPRFTCSVERATDSGGLGSWPSGIVCNVA